MKIENGKIIEATEYELYCYYLSRDWSDLYSFPTYKRLCEENGTVIVKERKRAEAEGGAE